MLRARVVLQILLLLLITFERPELSISKYSDLNILEVIQRLHGPKLTTVIPTLGGPILANDYRPLLSNSVINADAFSNDQTQMQFLSEMLFTCWQTTKFRSKTMFEEIVLSTLEDLLDSLF